MKQILIHNQTHPMHARLQVGYASSFFSRLRGLMFTQPILQERGLLLVQGRESRIDSSIHMFFVNYDLGTIWLNNDRQVVDTCLARKWHPYYASSKPARYVLEINPARMDEFIPGDTLTFENLSPD